MRFSARQFQTWSAPVLQLPAEAEQRAALELFRLDQAFSAEPRLLRRLADRSLTIDERMAWLERVLSLESDQPLAQVLRMLMQENGFTVWSTFFHEYLRVRERIGLGRVFLVRSQTALTPTEETAIRTDLESRFSQPATIAFKQSDDVKGGVEIESPDGWVLDATIAGRLSRLAIALAS